MNNMEQEKKPCPEQAKPEPPKEQAPPKAERPSKIAYVKYGEHPGDSQR